MSTVTLLAGLLIGLLVCTLLAQRGATRRQHDVDEDLAPLVERIEQCLPQTQCGECGFPGCRPYARALVRGQAGIDRCPPGGRDTVLALARLTGQTPPARLPAAPDCHIARIDETLCIGCVQCLQACPVDAIIGAARQMHSILPEHCTGCGLCLPPCPADCIALVPRPRRAPRA